MSSTEIRPFKKVEPRYIDPDAPLPKQVENLRALMRNPPENSRRVTFTPALAQYVLDHKNGLNVQNRSLREPRVRRYAEAMENDAWLLTGDTIKFSDAGFLRDGQHRLTACVRSQKPFTTYAVFGIPDQSFVLLDSGKPRGAEDVLHIAGYTNANTRAAAVRWHAIFTSATPNNRNLPFTNEDVHREHNKLKGQEFDDAITAARDLYKHSRFLTGGSMAALLYLYRHSPGPMQRFCADVRADKGDAAKLMKQLREFANANLGRLHENARNARIIMTLNAYVTGQRLPKGPRSPSWDGSVDPFPPILVAKP